MQKIYIKATIFFKKLKEDFVSEYAAECAYFTILSFIPFVIFFMTLIQFTNIEQDIIFDVIKEVIPSSMHTFVLNIIQEAYTKSVGTISISIVFALWSASKGFYALCKGFKTVYALSENNSNIISRIEGLIYTLLFMISLMIVMILIVFGNRIHEFVVANFFSWGFITALFLKIRTVITIIILFFIFLLLYKYMPRHKMTFKSQIPGALFSSVAWVITSFIFSIYIDIFKGFTNTYGSLTSIILIMMWVYVCMYIILIGAEINVFVQNYKNKNLLEK